MPPDKKSGPPLTKAARDIKAPAGHSTLPSVAAPMPRNWYHRNPCHQCGTCTSRACFVFNPDDVRGEIHICWRGCDGLPPALGGWAA
jgi:hypothetical protein